jgi:hypothetical protein
VVVDGHQNFLFCPSSTILFSWLLEINDLGHLGWSGAFVLLNEFDDPWPFKECSDVCAVIMSLDQLTAMTLRDTSCRRREMVQTRGAWEAGEATYEASDLKMPNGKGLLQEGVARDELRRRG